MEKLTLTYRETWEALGISKTTFYNMLRIGQLDHLRAADGRIPERFSKLKVEQFVNGKPVQSWRAVAS